MPASKNSHEEPTASEKLSELLKLMDIEEVYYVDDLFDYNPLPEILSYAKDLYDEKKHEALKKLFGNDVKLNVPDVGLFGDEIEKKWGTLEEKSQKEILSKMEPSVFDSSDYDRTEKLQSYFPTGMLKLVNPDDWEDTFKDIEKKYASKRKKVLVLFDQELKHAQGERFKSGRVTGKDLILSARKSKVRNNIVCALLTHLISEVSKELSERDKIIEKSQGALSKDDFFALTKKRINFPDKLCDGIKKTFLNEHCETIKEKATELIDKAYKEVIDKLNGLDTYDFDHIILRSSYGEGVWEVNTLMRIANNLYDQKIKELMVRKRFAKVVNPSIKDAKKLSDITFNIPANHQPYKEKLILRHHDIYYPGKYINKLHLPIENGDIFEIYEGGNKGLYILVGQECDLMMRTSRGGSGGTRAAKTAVLLKLQTFSANGLKKEIDKYLEQSAGSSHYYWNKFKLEYFIEGKKDVGIVNFNKDYRVNLDALDLIVFNSEGKANLNLSGKRFNIDLISAAWEMRYEKLFKDYSKKNKKVKDLASKLAALNNPNKQRVISSVSGKLATSENLGKVTVLSSDKFNFGIKRVLRLKKSGAIYLLDRYYKHLSRKAEPHDFVS